MKLKLSLFLLTFINEKLSRTRRPKIEDSKQITKNDNISIAPIKTNCPHTLKQKANVKTAIPSSSLLTIWINSFFSSVVFSFVFLFFKIRFRYGSFGNFIIYLQNIQSDQLILCNNFVQVQE